LPNVLLKSPVDWAPAPIAMASLAEATARYCPSYRGGRTHSLRIVQPVRAHQPRPGRKPCSARYPPTSGDPTSKPSSIRHARRIPTQPRLGRRYGSPLTLDSQFTYSSASV
jgi:hypothetical protein